MPEANEILARLDELHRCLDRHVQESTHWRESTDKRLDVMQGELTRNTEITESARGAYKALKFLGGLAAAIAPIAVAWQVFRGGGGGIGPTP